MFAKSFGAERWRSTAEVKVHHRGLRMKFTTSQTTSREAGKAVRTSIAT